ncbi:MAG: hypothetical protein R3D25_16480 [Geminicoccaceae bacterium]
MLERAGHVRLGPGRDERTPARRDHRSRGGRRHRRPAAGTHQAAITASVGAADLEVFGQVLRRLQELSPQVDEETPT